MISTWDTGAYGPQPERLPDTGENGVWPEVLFVDKAGYELYFQRKRLALTPFAELPPGRQQLYQVSAQCLHTQFIKTFPKTINYPVRAAAVAQHASMA